MKKLVLILLTFFLASLVVIYFQKPSKTKNSQATFDQVSAFQNLKKLSEDFGSKVVGTKEEIIVKEWIKDKLYEIKHCMKIGSLEIIEQIDSGEYTFEIAKNKRFIKYQNITNIIAYLKPNGDHYNDTFMVNSHFDTGISSPGWFDDGVPVVVMIEVLKSLCSYQSTLKHPILFLFNGAEELGLLGANSFMKHPLSKNVKYVFNLEAAGTGGRNFLFQSTSSWFMKNLKSVSNHLKGSSIAQDIFEAKLIPSDTDYRVYKENGIIGIDTAFYENGHVYHTSKDSIFHNNNESIYHMGENTEMITKFMATYNDNYPLIK